MPSKSDRRKSRVRQKRRRGQQSRPVDPHAKTILRSMADFSETMDRLAGSADPLQALEADLASIVAKLATRLSKFDAVRIIEVARIVCLPWSPEGQTNPDAEGGPTRAELIALLALTSATCPTERAAKPPAADGCDEAAALTRSDSHPTRIDLEARMPSQSQPLNHLIHDTLPLVDKVLHLAQMREMARADREDPLAMIAAMMRGSEVWVRNSSYPDMVATTLLQLFGQPQVSAQLSTDLGFDAEDAITVLQSCHDLQVNYFNNRMEGMAIALNAAMTSSGMDAPEQRSLTNARNQWLAAWEPEANAVTIGAEEITAASGLSGDIVRAVLTYFTLDVGNWDPGKAVEEFTSGNNPLRTNPVIGGPDGRVMLVHDAHVLVAVRENLEQHLKTTTVWEAYQKHRGDLLEFRTQTAFTRVLPTAKVWDGFEYYVPASEAEEVGPPNGYTKRVEGDHLIVQDDVAFIVEDKAVAISPSARAGESRRLRRDLTGIIKKAAAQATRLQDRIQQDKGIRIHGEGWIDLSRVREIHTVAVSLDDLTYASTATAELVKAGLLGAAQIPWTVSVHDLDLITQLIDRPSEFLLYLRRRRDPEATVYYTAPDELDLFLYFFEAGLYVEPDPDEIRKLVPFMPPPTTAERRRRRRQVPTLVTSRTDPLDHWYYQNLAKGAANGALEESDASMPPDTADAAAEPRPHEGAAAASTKAQVSTPAAPKPKMVSSPLGDLIDTVHQRADYAWLSIGATLLSGATTAQKKMARIPADLLNNPSDNGRERSVAMPIARSLEDGWLLVWITRPPGQQPDRFEQTTREYLRSKMHQLSLPRGVAFAYDEITRTLAGVYFDDHIGELEPHLQERLASLKPAGSFDSHFPPQAKKPRAPSPRASSKKSKSRKRR